MAANISRYNIYLKELNGLKSSGSKILAGSKIKDFKNIDESNLPFHSNQANDAFKPMRRTLTLLGRWPFQPETKLIQKNGYQKDQKSFRFNLEVYTSSLKSPVWLYFSLTTILLWAAVFSCVAGFCDIFLEWNLLPKTGWNLEEKSNFKTNIVPFVLVWSCLLHSAVSSVSLFTKRRKVVKLFNFWNVALDQLGLDVPKHIKRYVWISHLGYLIFVLSLAIVGYTIFKWSLIYGAALLIGIVILQPFIILFDLDPTRDLEPIRVFGAFVVCYAVYSSRAFLILFRFKCKLLNHGFKTWNGRFKEFLESPSPTSDNENTMEKSICEKLIHDYSILLKLVHLTDVVFGSVLQSYYATQLLNMCFELYYLAKSGSSLVGRNDIIGAVLLLFQNMYIFFDLSLEASFLSEEAMKGLEILRTHWIHPDDSVYRKYLMSHMQTVFSEKIVLTGKRYFSVDRPFIVTMLGSVFTYFIIILQIGPSLNKDDLAVEQ